MEKNTNFVFLNILGKIPLQTDILNNSERGDTKMYVISYKNQLFKLKTSKVFEFINLSIVSIISIGFVGKKNEFWFWGDF